MDKALYNDMWQDVIRPEILRRDNFKCQDCGVKHKYYIIRDKKGSWKYIEQSEYFEYNKLKMRVYKIFLQVAHLDCDKSNNDPTNLRTLCLWCHLKFDKSYKQLLRIAKKKGNVSYNLLNASFDALRALPSKGAPTL